MKVLVSAIACDPYGYSESFVGWQAVKVIAQDHDVWILTSSRYRESFSRASDEGMVPQNVHVIFHGQHAEWRRNRLMARMQSWLEYVEWNRTLLETASEAHQKIRFDLAHHVTYSSWRVGSPLWKLGIPLIWGPVGGAGSVPLQVFPTLSPSAMALETARLGTNIAVLTPTLRACVRNAALVLASTRETKALLTKIRGTTDHVELFCPAFFSKEYIEKLHYMEEMQKADGPLRIFAGGNIIGSKGVAIALRALAEVRKAEVPFLYTVAGNGPEIPFLERLTSQLGLQQHVTYVESFQGAEYLKQLQQSHLFLLPSFRENAGLTMMEAMLAQAVPIVANRSAPAEIVTDECGVKISVDSISRMVHQISEAIIRLNRNRDEIRSLGSRAKRRIEECYSERSYRTAIRSWYNAAVDC